jgi:uncharacterized protein YceH (UPF0502 family)
MSEATPTAEPSRPPQWKPLPPLDRRVIGVLVEKAKTTPEQYPLSLNALVNGCNQKNNRDPQMQVEADDVEESIERLRPAGALVEVQGSGRVLKYRHMMYDWLGVNKVELGVMTELLLRGAQTEGELRGRAARMDPIPDLAALRPIVDSLKQKGLIVSLTPEGRGHMLTHALYLPEEMESLSAQFACGAGVESPSVRPIAVGTPVRSAQLAPTVTRPAFAMPAASALPNASAATRDSERLSREMESLRTEVGQLRRDLEQLFEQIRRTEDGLRDIRSSLGG